MDVLLLKQSWCNVSSQPTIRACVSASLALVCLLATSHAQELRWNLNADSTRFVKLQIMSQFWVRYNESNPGTLQQGEAAQETFDIGIRRARIQCFAQVTERASLFLHYGFNNFNTNFNIGSNRKIQAFFHDVFGEYRVTDANELKLGVGLSFVNGLSRFSQPAVVALPTADIPVFGQATVEQIDVFGRKLSISARGQIGPIDYRIALSDPFPITSTGSALPAISSSSSFAQVGHRLQRQAYVIYQFRDHEPHQTPNMAGSYFGHRKIFNIGAGIMHQPRAMWRSAGADTLYEDLLLMAVESMFDAPIADNGTTLSAYVGLFMNDYGKNYLRYNGTMNPGTSTEAPLDSTLPAPLKQYGPTFGNAFPMFGTGKVAYSHVGVLFPNAVGGVGIMPYVSTTLAWYERLESKLTDLYNVGCSFLFDGIRNRVSIDIQNRPTYGISRLNSPFGELVKGERRTQVLLQYQIVL